MITEYNYIDLLKNCSKWNERTCRERKSRFRYPFYDHQTGTAHRPVQNYYKVPEQQHDSNDPSVYIQYSAARWKKRDHQPNDAIEMKMFLRDNPQLDAAVNQTSQVSYSLPEVSVTDVSMDISMTSKGTPKQNPFEDYTDDLDDEMSNGSGSDEDDWGAKRKKGKNASSKKKKASGAAGRPRESHACSKCVAKFKSLAGLTYHNAFVHGDPLLNPVNKLMSPNLEVSDYCDLCLGNRYMNKETKRAEDLVTCADCGRSGHPSCLKFSKNVPFIINRYGWQCIECKSCTICGTSENDAMLLFCDDCDRGFHLYCLRPPLSKAPEGEYSCDLCLRAFGPNASAPR